MMLSLFHRCPTPMPRAQPLRATEDPVLQLLEVAEEAVAAVEAGSATEEAIGWAEAAVETLDRLAGAGLFPSSLPSKDPDANRDFMELLAKDPEDLVGELIAQHQQANPTLAEIIRAAGSGVVFLGAKEKAAVAGRRAVAEALHDFRAAIAAQRSSTDSVILAERTPRLRERIAAAKGARCPA